MEVYRQEILEHVVPVVNKLYQRQADRLGLESLKPYDLEYKFQSGNATMPQGRQKKFAAGVKMYHELSSEIGEFVDFMVDRELLDLVTKPGKAKGVTVPTSDYEAPLSSLTSMGRLLTSMS